MAGGGIFQLLNESVVFIFFFLINFFNVYNFWEKERQRESRGGAEREGATESEAGSRLRAVSAEPHVGLKLTNCKIMTWAEVGSLADWATQAPLLSSNLRQLEPLILKPLATNSLICLPSCATHIFISKIAMKMLGSWQMSESQILSVKR